MRRRPGGSVNGQRKTLLVTLGTWLILGISGCSGVTSSNKGGGTPPPLVTVSNATSTNVTANSATIAWTTNVPATSQVEYGKTTSYGSQTTSDSSMVTNHSQVLSSLTPSTLYHYRVHSRDANNGEAVGADFTLTTAAAPDTTPPVISAVSSSPGLESAAINWITNEAADSEVEYGTTASYGQSSPLDSTQVTSHSVLLTGLAASTLYHYRVKSRDGAGNLMVSADFSFTTNSTGRAFAVSPGDSSDSINRQISGLMAGDTLVFLNGTYLLADKLVLSRLVGTAQNPITIRAETAGQVVLAAAIRFTFNMIEIYNSQYVELDGLELTGSFDGLNLHQVNDHIALLNLHIHHTGNIGIAANGIDVVLSFPTVRGCHIHDIGIGGGTGEGMYLGHHGTLEGYTHHALIEHNYIHDTTASSSGEGIEIKHGGYANIVQDNVLHDVRRGITDYITGRNNPADVNVIRRNVIWNADDFGIWSAGDSLIENNIIFAVRSGSGILISQNVSLPSFGVKDLTIRNNTVFDACCNTSSPALYIKSVETNVVVANNAFYQPDANGFAIRLDVPLSSITLWRQNFFYGQLDGLSTGPGTIPGKPPGQEFVNGVPIVGTIDLYPLSTSSFLSAADPSTLAGDDFNRNQRPSQGAGEVGAYEFYGPTNPGWKIQPGFKP